MILVQKIAVIVLLLMSLGSLLTAQGGATGAISGTLMDAKGAVIAGAQINIINNATGQTVRQLKTDASGLFNALLLPVGTYSVEVNAEGFATTKIEGVVVRITETTRLSTELKPSAVKEEVEVHSDVVALDTSNATTGQSIDEVTVTSLPLATRNFQQLLDLSAGATASLNNAAALGRGDVRIDVNGGREDNNNYLIEGISASDYAIGELTYTPVPNPDSIQEFKVGTSLYDATQGRNGGGNINAILKSGASQFHGDAWEYFRNTALDATDYFIGKFPLRQNIFGTDLGGPVTPKGKLGFFYVNYQGTRQSSGDSLGTYVSGANVPVLPSNRSCSNLVGTFFPGALASKLISSPNNTTCGLDPVAVRLLQASGTQFGSSPGGYLIPTVSGTAGLNSSGAANYGPWNIDIPGHYTDDQFTANWDRDFNHGKDHLSERIFWSDSQLYEPFGADNLQIQTGYPASPTNLNFPLNIPLRGRFASIAETHTFSTSLLNEFRFGVNIISDSFQNVPIPGTSAGDLGIQNGSGAPDMYRFQFGTGLQIGPYPTQLQSALTDSFVWLDTLSWTRGRHSVRLGGEIDHTSIRRNLPVLDNGLLYFLPGADSSLNEVQNFLLGEPTYGEAGGGASNHDYQVPGFSIFAQDDYRITQRMTLNLGMRTEWVGAASDSLCHLGNAIPENAATTGSAFIYPSCVSKYGIAGFSGTLNNAGLNNEYATVLEPRLGFAYDVAGDHKTVVRGGYGIYSVREDIGAVDNMSFSAPFYPVLVNGGSPGSLSTLYAGLPPLGQVNGAYLPTPSVFQGFQNSSGAYTNDATQSAVFSGTAIDYINLSVPLHWIVPTTQQWNLTIQRELVGDWVLEIGYVGTKGTHLRSTYDPDQATLASPSNPVTITCGSPIVQCQGAANGTKYTITQSTAANLMARAPYPGIDPEAFESFAPNSDAHYNGLQLSLSHHFSKGLYLQSAYTFSKSIDDVSTSNVAFLTRFNDQTNPRDSRGLSDFDRRQRFVTSFNYALPSLVSRKDFAGPALSNWEAGGVIVLQSGSPITIVDGDGGTAYGLSSADAVTANFAPGYGCGNALTHGSLPAKLANWVNPLAYQAAPVVGVDGTTGYGDTPRNCVIGPGQENVDFTLAKTFKFAEHQSLRFRTEFFNLFNHPSFANPSIYGTANVQSAQVGEINQTVGTPRLIQFSLKYSY